MNQKALLLGAVVCSLFALGHNGFAQNTEFTYQGQVQDDGTNFTGTGLFEFALVTSTNTSSQATATATRSGTFITSYTVTFGGSGYTSPPTVTITGGGGTGATATANLTSGVVTSLTPGSAGMNYTGTPTVTIAPPPANITYTTYWSNDGTSVNGSEPASAVSAGVNGGLVTVVLGNTNLPNMTAIPDSIFAQQASLQLRIWFNDGVNGFAALSPLQPLTPAPYAVQAINATSASNLTGTLAATQLTGPIPTGDLTGTYTSALTLNNTANSFSGSYSGNGASLSNLNASQLTSGVVPNGVLPGFQSSSNFNVVSGGSGNSITGGSEGTVGGGLNNNNGASYGTVSGGQKNTNSASFGVIGGGFGNITGDVITTVAGGENNHSSINGSAIGGGFGNSSSGADAVIAGGNGNIASAQGAAVGGGYNNSNTANYATIPGGFGNLASASNSLAAGYYAHATNTGSFVWSDSSSTNGFGSSGSNTFNVRAAGGVKVATTGGAGLTVDGMYVGYGPGTGGMFFSPAYSVAVGNGALQANTAGYYNTALGSFALEDNTGGIENTATGSGALSSLVVAYDNTANGYQALNANTNGSYNTAIGATSLANSTTGSYNTAVGYDALQFLVSGGTNIVLGYNAGTGYLGGESGNIIIGHQGVSFENNTIRVGTQSSQTRAFVAGIYGSTVASGVAVYANSDGQLGALSSSRRFKDHIQEMNQASDVLYSLSPVTFKYKSEIDPQGIPQFGLVAEEVEKVAPELVAHDDQNKIFTVRYQAVDAMLLNEFLKEHRKVEEQGAEIQALQEKLDKLEKLVTATSAAGK